MADNRYRTIARLRGHGFILKVVMQTVADLQLFRVLK